MRRKQFQYVAVTILGIQIVFLWCLLTPYSSIIIQDAHAVEASSDTNASHTEFLVSRGITLREDGADYFVQLPNGWPCFRSGIDQSALSHTLCVCMGSYYGKDCGIPAPVWYSVYRENEKPLRLKRRKYPRRIIHVVMANAESQHRVLETRMEKLLDAVDAYIIIDTSPDSSLLFRLQGGFLADFQHKIVYTPHVTDESFIYSTQNGFDRIANRRDDDLILILQDDQLPDREVLTFLKNYNGYPEPVSLRLHQAPGATYRREDEPRTGFVTAACSLSMLRQVYLYDPTRLREPLWDQHFLKRYVEYRSNAHHITDFAIGTLDYPAVSVLD